MTPEYPADDPAHSGDEAGKPSSNMGEFSGAATASPMQITTPLGPDSTDEPSDFFAVMELSGNGFTFEIRDRQSFAKKYKNIDRIKVKLPNSADIRATGAISQKSVDEIKKQLHVIQALINDYLSKGHNVYLKAVGTAALRDASNREAIMQDVRDMLGDQVEFEVIDGEVEASLCAQGVTLFYPDISGVVVDMGGGSTEFALVENGHVIEAHSLSFGTASINEAIAKKGTDQDKYIAKALKELPKAFRKQKHWFLSGGTLRNINNSLCSEQGVDIRGATPPETSFGKYMKHINALLSLETDEWLRKPANLQNRREFLPAAMVLVRQISELSPRGATLSMTKTKTRDGLFRAIEDMMSHPDTNPLASLNTEFLGPEQS